MAIMTTTTKSISAPRSLGRALNLAAGRGSAVCNRLLEPHGLSLAQWAVLSCLWRNGPLGVKDIAELTGNEPSAASRIVDRMVAGALVVRRPDAQDRRAVIVDLDARGEALRPLREIYEEVNAVLTADLSEQEAEILFDLLDRVERAGRAWLSDPGSGG
ncbi:MarR family winged helix-turn-helix transcriptional regulator [Salinarimonas chemoclinalis]|uniref:MarR family winged helix-turn-helix transcriptional regulator n=1 Tax=Salinarimonas chemoclinalis TaxID=3241599 RepID=UPI0035564A6A